MISPPQTFAAEHLAASTETLRALAHPLRLDIVNLLRANGWVTVQSIYQSLGLEQSLTSQHLRVLRRADLVVAQRDGKHVSYRVNAERYAQVERAIANFLGEETGALA